MRIYLVQHGEAVPAEVHPERPLSAAGEADVRRIAAVLRGGVGIARILHSGKRRAEQIAARCSICCEGSTRCDRRDAAAAQKRFASGRGRPLV